MCELKSVMRIHSWATTKTVSKFLAESFGIKRITCYGRLPELPALIKPDSLNCCMMKFVASLCPELIAELEKQAKKKKRPVTVSLDGKTIRSTAKMAKYDSPLHIVSAYASELGVTLAQKSVEGKSNEIPAVQ